MNDFYQNEIKKHKQNFFQAYLSTQTQLFEIQFGIKWPEKG